jgi:hypothetical protein
MELDLSRKEALLASPDEAGRPRPNLKTGLYFLTSETNNSPPSDVKTGYLVYWPEHTSWDDKAISSVNRNRVTFMRSTLSRQWKIVLLIPLLMQIPH